MDPPWRHSELRVTAQGTVKCYFLGADTNQTRLQQGYKPTRYNPVRLQGDKTTAKKLHRPSDPCAPNAMSSMSQFCVFIGQNRGCNIPIVVFFGKVGTVVAKILPWHGDTFIFRDHSGKLRNTDKSHHNIADIVKSASVEKHCPDTNLPTIIALYPNCESHG